MSYTAEQRDQIQPPPCPRCGTTLTIDWVDITAPGDGGVRRYVMGGLTCPAPGCGYGWPGSGIERLLPSPEATVQPPTAPRAWAVALDDYTTWPPQAQEAARQFARDNDLDDNNVAIGHHNELSVHRTAAGLVLRTWVYDRDPDGKIRLCPTCPDCLRFRLVEVPLRTRIPDLPGAVWYAGYTRHIIGETQPATSEGTSTP